MAEVERVLKSYITKIGSRTATLTDDIIAPVVTGVPSMDENLRLYPGMTLIYSHPDGGRTSLAKRLAISAHKQGLNTVYHDTENKLYLHNPKVFDGIVLAHSYKESGLKEIVANGFVDFMIVDTITGLHKSSQESFLIQVKKYVPYIIVLTQMRDMIQQNQSSPAAKDHILSSAHTWIYLTSKENLIIEGVSVERIQYQYTKCEMKRELTGYRSSFIIKDNIADSVYSAYDFLRSSGFIHSIGKCKFYTDQNGVDVELGAVKDIAEDESKSKQLISIWKREAKIDSSLPLEDIYVGRSTV